MLALSTCSCLQSANTKYAVPSSQALRSLWPPHIFPELMDTQLSNLPPLHFRHVGLIRIYATKLSNEVAQSLQLGAEAAQTKNPTAEGKHFSCAPRVALNPTLGPKALYSTMDCSSAGSGHHRKAVQTWLDLHHDLWYFINMVLPTCSPSVPMNPSKINHCNPLVAAACCTRSVTDAVSASLRKAVG